MRSEQEMYNLILETAQKDERILAVYMNGSRTNKQVPKDMFQDYDIVYVVTDTRPFIEVKTWIDRFGERLYMQYPDEFPGYGDEKYEFYGWLMQFTDGNRIDLHVETVSHAKENIRKDRLCRVLLDKQGILPKMPEATDEDFWIQKPSQFEFSSVCNEFWWCLNNVAKGLWRNEISYVMDMINFHIRPQLGKVLCWKAGTDYDFRISAGKGNKYLHKWIIEEEWNRYLATYSAADVSACWEAVGIMCQLFEETAILTAEKLGYVYDMQEGKNSMKYLMHIKNLPADCTDIPEIQ